MAIEIYVGKQLKIRFFFIKTKICIYIFILLLGSDNPETKRWVLRCGGNNASNKNGYARDHQWKNSTTEQWFKWNSIVKTVENK
jgi:hypothetical protein